MNGLEYAEIVIERLHKKTLKGNLSWSLDGFSTLKTNPTPSIQAAIEYLDDDPGSSTWQFVNIRYPVGIGVVRLVNPGGSRSSSFDTKASGKTLDRINEIFRHVLLDPREKQFQEAMKELEKS